MPYADTIRPIALGLLALGVLWVILAAIGLRPRAIRLRRTIKRSGSSGLLCGSCGHPAVSLGSIGTCPECGSEYAEVGLDGRATPSRWSPPVFVLGVFLLALWALGSLSLAPMAARWANQRAIGSAELERWQSKAAFVANSFDPATGWSLAVAVEVDRDLLGPATAPAGQSERTAIWGTITIRMTTGPNARSAESMWISDPMTNREYLRWEMANPMGDARLAGKAPPPPPPMAGALASPWDGLRASEPTFNLERSPTGPAWTLSDASGAILERGDRPGEARRALISAAFKSRSVDDQTRIFTMLEEDLRLLDEWPPIDALEEFRPSYASTFALPNLRVLSEITATPSRTLFHPSAPWGLTAAIATSASLALLAIVLLFLCWRSKRGPAAASA